ncbi:MAG TPA: hypothetical protein VFD80_04475 [Flavobacteriaceae bacterium]|nr:hypothetical protein [Flavobacteriaceae bacterium]
MVKRLLNILPLLVVVLFVTSANAFNSTTPTQLLTAPQETAAFLKAEHNKAVFVEHNTLEIPFHFKYLSSDKSHNGFYTMLFNCNVGNKVSKNYCIDFRKLIYTQVFPFHFYF